jgi:hypothetical protein
LKKILAMRELKFDVNHIGHMPVTSIHQHDVTANHIVAVVSRRRRQCNQEIMRHWMQPVAPAFIQNESNLQPRLPAFRKPVNNAKSDWWMIAMTCPPSIHDYMLVIVEPRMLVVPMVIMTVLSVSGSADANHERCGDGC